MHNGSTSTTVTSRTLHPSAPVGPLLLSPSSTSCAPKAIGPRARTTGSATARATSRTSILYHISAIPSSTPILSLRLASASGVSATRTSHLPYGCSGSSRKLRGSLTSRKSTSRNRLVAGFPLARIQSVLVRSRRRRTETSIFRTFTAGSPGSRSQASSVVVPARRRSRRAKSLVSVDGVWFDASLDLGLLSLPNRIVSLVS